MIMTQDNLQVGDRLVTTHEMDDFYYPPNHTDMFTVPKGEVFLVDSIENYKVNLKPVKQRKRYEILSIPVCNINRGFVLDNQ